MGSFINNGDVDFIVDSARHRTSAATFAQGQSFQFGSLDFITDKLGKVHLCHLALSQSVKDSLPSSLGLSFKPTSAAISKDKVTQKLDLLLEHGPSPIEHGSQLVGMINSLLPILNYDSGIAESLGRHHPSRGGHQVPIFHGFLVEWTEAQYPPSVIDLKHWTLYFDGSLMLSGTGASIVLLSSKGEHFKYVLQIHFPVSNNIAGYEALLHALCIATSLKIRRLLARGEFELVVRQVMKV